ncbi:MAG: hypothetical protein DCC46_05885 [Armatimonadetes bacterium]|nr:MAG: hypothetical protein DCC46_05885 [Armatimonadota bacterium]
MIAVALLLGSLCQGVVEDYFPLTSGTRWVYEEKSGDQTNVVVDEALPPIRIDGKTAFPVTSKIDGKVIETRFYGLIDNTIHIVAFKQDSPLSEPIPVLKFDGKRTSWEFSGMTPMQTIPVPLTLRGTADAKGKRTVLGMTANVIESTVTGVLDTGGGTKIESKQVAIYAQGIGLIEFKEWRKIADRETVTTTTLVKFTQPN